MNTQSRKMHKMGHSSAIQINSNKVPNQVGFIEKYYYIAFDHNSAIFGHL